MIEFFRQGQEPEPTDEEIQKQRAGRFGALGVVAGAGLAIAGIGANPREAAAQILSSSEKMELADSVKLTDLLAETSTPEKRLSLYKQIIEGFAESAVAAGRAAVHGQSRVFIHNSGRGAVAVDGELSADQQGRPFMKSVTAYIQISPRTLAVMRTFDFEATNSTVSFEIAVVGKDVLLPDTIIDIGTPETAREIFQRIPLLLSGKSARALHVSINRATGLISNCGVMSPIATIPDEIASLGGKNLAPAPITEIVLADDYPQSRYRADIKPEAGVIAERLWSGVATYFVPLT